MQMLDIRDRLSHNLAAAMRVHADNLSAGRPSDYAQYQKVVGVIKGLHDAIDIVDQVFHKLLDEPEGEKYE